LPLNSLLLDASNDRQLKYDVIYLNVVTKFDQLCYAEFAHHRLSTYLHLAFAMFETAKLLVTPRASQRTYYDADYRQGQSLIRARRPFLIKNALTGLAILGFTASVYIYTIKAVAQDDFDDVLIPEATVQNPRSSHANTGTTSAPLAK